MAALEQPANYVNQEEQDQLAAERNAVSNEKANAERAKAAQAQLSVEAARIPQLNTELVGASLKSFEAQFGEKYPGSPDLMDSKFRAWIKDMDSTHSDELVSDPNPEWDTLRDEAARLDAAFK